MSNDIAISRMPIRRVLNQVGSKYAYFYDAIVAFAGPALLTNLVNDTTNRLGNVLDWLVISLAGYAGAAAILLLGRTIFFKSGLQSSLLNLGVFAVAGLVRGLIIFNLGSVYKVISPNDFNYRIFGSILFTVLMFSLITILVSNAVRSSRKLDELEHQMLLLQDALIHLRGKLAVQKAELAGRVKALINPMIEGLIAKVAASRGTGSVSDAVVSLKASVDDDIRPLSLAIGTDDPANLVSQTGKPKSKFRVFTRLEGRIKVGSMISPFWMTLFMALLAAPAASHIFGVSNWGYQIALVMLLAFALLELAKRLLANVLVVQDLAFMIQVVVYLLVGFIADLATCLSPFNHVHYTPGRVTLFAVVTGIGFFVGQLFQLQREAATASLVSINEHLERLNSEARRELWLYRRKVATVLHGPVQARLYAAAIRLAQAKRVTAGLVDGVSEELRSVLTELDFDRQDRVPLREIIRQIIDVWSGTCEIYSKIDKAVFIAAKRDGNFEAAFIEVVREAISNAVKHGQASEIEVHADLVGDLVQLQLVNNGKSITTAEQPTAGFGSSLMTELTLRWALTGARDGRTEFNAEFVVA